MRYFLNEKGQQIILKIVAGIKENKVFLGDVDGLIGDGDHGMNMNKGFSEYEKRFGLQELSFSDGLIKLGTILLTEIGGSMGPIYGTILMSIGDSLETCEKIHLLDLCTALNKARRELFDIVDARVGDKTLVDCFSPACDALDSAVKTGKKFGDALDDMVIAALKGRDSTKNLEARYGRSSRLGARSIGVLDAGACSCCIILQSMANGIKEELEVQA